MDLQAAIGIHQLERVNKNLVRRNEIWEAYNRAFADLPFGLPAADEPDTIHSRHLYTLMVDKDRCGISRDQMLVAMQKQNIGSGVHYVGVHLHPYYRDRFGYQDADFPNATWISDRTISIPLSPKLNDEDVADVVDAVKNCLA
jgi:dTDP-4-amino-4,6-dideoxygalactose transaminase